MKETVFTVLERHLPSDNINRVLLDKLKRFRHMWGSKDVTYIEFLSSGLIGMHPIRFSDQDDDILFRDILNIDKEEIQKEFYKTPGIVKAYKVSSNATNIVLVCLLSLVWKTSLPEDIKIDAMKDIYHIFAYKQIGSMYSHWFKYETPLPIAKAVFESLTDKYLIKKLGTWENLFNHQAKVLLPPKGSVTKKLISGTTDDIVKVINDFQNRIRDILKNIYIKLIEVKEGNNNLIKTTNQHNLLSDDDGGTNGLKEMTDNPNKYIVYLKSIINQATDFINKDYIYLVSKFNKNIDNKKLEEVLFYISQNILDLDKEDFISPIIESSLVYLKSKKIHNYKTQLLDCLKLLTGYFKASKVPDVNLRNAKQKLYKITEEALNINTKWVITPIVLSICLYLFIRSIVVK